MFHCESRFLIEWEAEIVSVHLTGQFPAAVFSIQELPLHSFASPSAARPMCTLNWNWIKSNWKCIFFSFWPVFFVTVGCLWACDGLGISKDNKTLHQQDLISDLCSVTEWGEDWWDVWFKTWYQPASSGYKKIWKVKNYPIKLTPFEIIIWKYASDAVKEEGFQDVRGGVPRLPPRPGSWSQWRRSWRRAWGSRPGHISRAGRVASPSLLPLPPGKVELGTQPSWRTQSMISLVRPTVIPAS